MTTSELKAKFARLGPTQAAGLDLSGSPEIVTIRSDPTRITTDTIAATLLLRRSGLSVLKAKRAIEAVVIDGSITIEIPRVDDAAALERAFQAIGFRARVRSREAPNVQALREGLGLTQEQFAARFGLEIGAVRNWEHARRTPDTAARSLLKVIARYPDLVAEAQDG